ncbi:MAG TPA: SpoIID/LytB domain-containing protein [Oscillatoriales cyanobacterium M59_W2019_021]|nr:SpoIID/LytB domain-containing protein [Oscillatoriales cyanobacterium M4454_W2019_049]HIK52519.1 SpoIID/LytB domain-containing protein [Oscillatoriales cyanobacterium M59_W2019_021]
MKQRRWLSGILLVGCCGWGGAILPEGVASANEAAAVQNPDIQLQVGIVQRFGDNPKEKLILKAPPGNALAVRYEAGDGTLKTSNVPGLQLEITPSSLPEPKLDERLVLSTHRSFEDAEAKARQWKEQGIEVEIAQPDRWEVWAKRDVYATPLLRRRLLQSLEAAGQTGVNLQSQVKQQVPQASWVINGYRYNRDRLEVVSNAGVIQVSEGENARTTNYGGNLRLQPNAYGDYTLVNDVPLEVYLRGVVPHEIGGGAPYEAVKAQAILARTYALRNLRRFAADNYQLCADVNCQVYKGLSGTTENTDRAIAETAGQVLVYQNELVDALYSSTTGGVTATYRDIWAGVDRPYLTATIDSAQQIWDLPNNSLAEEQNIRRFLNLKKGFNEDGGEYFRWKYNESLADMTAFLKQYFRRKNRPIYFNKITELKVSERSPSGRVQKLEVTTDGGTIVIPKDEILTGFYAPISTLFYLEPIKEADNKTLWGYSFIGGGFGHGVGLSQTGAAKLAELGWTSDRILQFYFPGTELRNIDGSIVFWQEPTS